MSVGTVELHWKQVLPESVMTQICFTCLIGFICHALLTLRYLHSLPTLGKDRGETSHGEEGVLWIHLLAKKIKELFCWVYQWLNPDAPYLWQSIRMAVLCNILEALCLRRADTVISASFAHPQLPTPSVITGLQGLFFVWLWANAHTDGPLILILVWWILRHIIPQSSLAFSRFWKEVNPCPSLLQGGSSSCLHEVQEWEADQKATQLPGAVTKGLSFQLGNKKASGI